MSKKRIRGIFGILISIAFIFTYFHSEKNEDSLKFPSVQEISELFDTANTTSYIEGDFKNSTIFLYSSTSNSFLLTFDENSQFHTVKLNDIYTNIVRLKNGSNEYIVFNKERPKDSLKILRYNDKISIDRNEKEFISDVSVIFEKMDEYYACYKKVEGFYGYQFVFENKDYFSILSKNKDIIYELKDVDHLGL